MFIILFLFWIRFLVDFEFLTGSRFSYCFGIFGGDYGFW